MNPPQGTRLQRLQQEWVDWMHDIMLTACREKYYVHQLTNEEIFAIVMLTGVPFHFTISENNLFVIQNKDRFEIFKCKKTNIWRAVVKNLPAPQAGAVPPSIPQTGSIGNQAGRPSSHTDFKHGKN